jgi:hypothetical protein
MSSLTDPTFENGKILLIGDQGSGKTGAKAALVALGYKLRMLDTDKGFKLLRALLTDFEHYPYASYMKKHNIVPDVSCIPIEVPIDETTTIVKGVSWETLGPTSSKAWTEVVRYLREWKDGKNNYGAITDWDQDTVLDFDTMSTLAEIAKIWAQDLNGHIGSMIDEHGRDTGIAQDKINQLIMKMMNPSVLCNVIFTAHIKRVDMSTDVPQSPEARLRDKKSIDPQGFPAVIGQATSPFVGKRFNDQFIVKRDGNGRNAERRIWTVPTDNTSAKNSVWLEDSYPVETGLASIMEALRYKPAPIEFLEHCAEFHKKRTQNPNPSSKDTKPSNLGGFGTK